MNDEGLRVKIQKATLELRKNAYTDNYNFSNCVMTEVRKGYLEGRIVDRLIIFLRGTGCYLTRKQGGCTFCGFYNATNFNNKIPDKFFIKQVENVIDQYGDDISKYPIICIYNDGSLLCEEEISKTVVNKLFELFENIKSVKKVVIESRVDDLKENRIKEIRKVYHKEIEIAVGFESWNQEIREFCMNKYFRNENFESMVGMCRNYNVSIIPLMIVKPPFLTEKEAIEDYVRSIKYLNQLKLSRIDMEIMTIEKNTLVYSLWKNGLYKVPKLWTVIEILKWKEKLGLEIPVYISPMHYSVEAECMASNCLKCDNTIIQKFDEYNETGLAKVFDDVNCNCKTSWLKRMKEKQEIKDIKQRVESMMDRLELGKDI